MSLRTTIATYCQCLNAICVSRAVLRRTPAALWAVRHFLALKLPWAARTCRRNDFAYFDRLYRRWAPGWSGPEREETMNRAKRALSSPATLAGAIAYYPRPVLRRPPSGDRSRPARAGADHRRYCYGYFNEKGGEWKVNLGPYGGITYAQE